MSQKHLVAVEGEAHHILPPPIASVNKFDRQFSLGHKRLLSVCGIIIAIVIFILGTGSQLFADSIF